MKIGKNIINVFVKIIKYYNNVNTYKVHTFPLNGLGISYYVGNYNQNSCTYILGEFE